MSKLIRGLAAIALGLVVDLVAAGPLPGPIVDTQWLAANLDKVQVVDVRSNVKSYVSEPEFETDAKTGKKTLGEVGGHIAGSRLIDMKTMRTERVLNGITVKYMVPARADFEKAVQAAGIEAGKPIVLVAVGSEVSDIDDALRVYWQFKVYGEDDIAVLDGGMAAWLIEGRPHRVDAALARTGTWLAKADRSDRYFAGSEDVAKAIGMRSASLVDARDVRQFHGLAKRDYVYSYGHLEGARLYPAELVMKQSSGALKFMSPATYRGLLKGQGIDPDAPAITYCNSGHLSSGPWFLMSELLGNAQVRLYDGSLHQWTLEKRPLVGAVPLN
ncbi:MAG: sulfurtransferase [Burkholderiaceae bacterium]|nr:sulfurtransferase [Burkholderiaceae bacterium]